MRSFRHWTPRYIKNRLAEMYYHRTCPDHPWLTRAANDILATYLRASDVGLEFGSGRSTLWFARRVHHLTSVEHNEVWYRKVRQMLTDSGQQNVEYHLVPKDRADAEAGDAAYVKTIERIATASMDFVLIDGVYRDFCAFNCLRVLRPGGLLIIDNVNMSLPSTTPAPFSRTPAQGPKSPKWAEVQEALRDWRVIWTTSGVTDTALFFKPAG